MFLEKFYICRLAAHLYLIGGPPQEMQKCVVEAKVKILPFYAGAKDALIQNPAAMTLLKDLYAAWLGALDALPPSPGERDNAYHVRISALEDKLATMGHRVEIEAQ